MYKTVVLDGKEQVNIDASVSVGVSAEATSGCAPELVVDGEGSVDLAKDAGAALSLVEDGELGLVIKVGSVASDYQGPTEVTPTEQRQVLSTSGKTLGTNIVVNPIPSNYGRIAWDGRALKVY